MVLTRLKLWSLFSPPFSLDTVPLKLFLAGGKFPGTSAPGPAVATLRTAIDDPGCRVIITREEFEASSVAFERPELKQRQDH